MLKSSLNHDRQLPFTFAEEQVGQWHYYHVGRGLFRSRFVGNLALSDARKLTTDFRLHLADGATVATTVKGEYKNVTAFVDYIKVCKIYTAPGPNPIVLLNSPLSQTSFLACVSNDTTTSIPSTPAPPVLRIRFCVSRFLPTPPSHLGCYSGFRSDQIILGVSADGRSYCVAEADAVALDDNGDQVSMRYPPFNMTEIDATLNATAAGDARAKLGHACGGGYSYNLSGVYIFQGLVEAVFLNDTVHLANLETLEEEDPLFVQGLGEELWEDCSEQFDLNKKMLMVSISAEQKVNAVLCKYEHRNALAAQKATTATTNAAAVEELRVEQ
ncbi:hypothetical protein FRC05_005929 [Tulasnella sp. 425]|nr:hypothetical protein FRC05_005929 [Tulasnella sp. 425]